MTKFLLFFLSIVVSSLNADIVTTDRIQVIEDQIDDNSIVLLNVAEVLLDTQTSLGSQPWRKFLRSRVSPQLHDDLTLFVFKEVPPKSPESITPSLVKKQQEAGHLILAFTSRGRSEWYTSQIEGIDLITEKALNQVGYDFSKSDLKNLSILPTQFNEYFHNGIIYTTNQRDKGELLTEMLLHTKCKPSKIILVDDKIESLQEIEKMMSNLNIPFIGYLYTKTKEDRSNFDPWIAAIQLDWLISYGKILTDLEAAEEKKTIKETNLESYFSTILEKWRKV